MISEYFSLSDFRRMWHDINYAPNGKQGAYCKTKQKKRRKQQRRVRKVR